jgi:Arc/MetJ family transcription regulator
VTPGDPKRVRIVNAQDCRLEVLEHDAHRRQEVVMTVTQIDLDDDALDEAMRLSGARSKKDTVNLALREYAARHRRIAALDHYVAAAAGWDYEGWQEIRAASKAPAG